MSTRASSLGVLFLPLLTRPPKPELDESMRLLSRQVLCGRQVSLQTEVQPKREAPSPSLSPFLLPPAASPSSVLSLA